MLGRTVGELEEMPAEEFDEWKAYFEIKSEREEARREAMKTQGKPKQSQPMGRTR